MRFRVATVLFAVLSTSSLYAQTAEQTPLTEALAKPADTLMNALPQSYSALPAIGKMIGALLVVLLLMYFTFQVLKRVSGGKMIGSKGKKSLEVIEATHLAPKKSVALVRVGERAVMVGVTDHQITLLSELSPEETGKLIEKRQEEANQQPFADMLQTAFKKFSAVRTKRQDAVVDLPANQSA
jgi:flagellar protein FliO/FliZ